MTVRALLTILTIGAFAAGCQTSGVHAPVEAAQDVSFASDGTVHIDKDGKAFRWVPGVMGKSEFLEGEIAIGQLHLAEDGTVTLRDYRTGESMALVAEILDDDDIDTLATR